LISMKFFEAVRIPGIQPRRELAAGLTLGAVSIPISMGYSTIAHMPLATGLYAMILPAIVYAALGSSRHLVLSADSATAAILAAGLTGLAPFESQNYVALAGLVAGLTGVFLLIARILKLGFIANFLSKTLLIGFLFGVGVTVAMSQLPKMLGISTTSSTAVAVVRELSAHVESLSLPTVVVSTLTFAILLIGRKLQRGPIEVLVVVTGIAIAGLGWLRPWSIASVGTLTGGLPHLAWPTVPHGKWPHLFIVALSLSIVILAQSTTVARSYAMRHGERIDHDHDLVGLGFSNLAAMATGAFVVNSSVTKTELGDRLESQSQWPSLISAALAVSVLLLAPGLLSQLPACILATVVFYIAVSMTHISSLFDIYRRRPDEFVVAVITAIAVIAIGIEEGILISVVLCLLNHIRHGYHPKTGLVARDHTGHLVMFPLSERMQVEPGVFLYRFQSALYYANVERMFEEVRLLCDTTPEILCIAVDLSATTDIDYTTGQVLGVLANFVADRRIHFALLHAEPEVQSQLGTSGLTESDFIEFDADLSDLLSKYST
jgi:MFS superfamily sulfate permease-like transporter